MAVDRVYRVNKTGSFIATAKYMRYIKISLAVHVREILITGTNNVIKLVRFVDFSLCRFSVRVDGRYSVSLLSSELPLCRF